MVYHWEKSPLTQKFKYFIFPSGDHKLERQKQQQTNQVSVLSVVDFYKAVWLLCKTPSQSLQEIGVGLCDIRLENMCRHHNGGFCLSLLSFIIPYKTHFGLIRVSFATSKLGYRTGTDPLWAADMRQSELWFKCFYGPDVTQMFDRDYSP